ncbi:MAG: HipA domain-containing protein [Robiginitomaculum sp.]|nr:HipA domain-containing protein [Robiginitomaculum sp.]
MARAIGIDVPEVKLIPVSAITNLPEGIDKIEAQAFAIRRFDRADSGERIHMEDFAQVFGVLRPDDKYERAGYRSMASNMD